MEDYVSTHIRLEKEQYDHLRDESHETRRSQSDIVREALEMRWARKKEEKIMTQEKLLEIIREMVAENWANSDLDARTEKILTFIVENDYEGRDEDLETFVDRINSAQTETPALFIVQDALYYSGWNFEKAMM